MKFKLYLPIIFFICVISGHAQSEHVHYTGSKTIPLTGSWRLVMNEFLTYEQVLKDQSSVSAQVPGTWNDILWKGQPVGPYGFGTYYRQVIIDPSVKTQKLALEVSEISLAYHLYANNKLIGGKGTPGKSAEEARPKIDYGIFDFEATSGDTITLIFHVSNFNHESGGVWYAPNLGTEQTVRQTHDLNKGISLLIIGSFILAALFQLYIFIKRKNQKFGLYFFFCSVALIMLSATRGDMVIMDFFPNLSWVALKRMLYISLFMLGPMNGLFLRELFPKYFAKKIIQAMVLIAIAVSDFTLLVPPRISYAIVPIHHAYNVVIGTYMLVSLIRAAIANRFGARFLLVGYSAAFITALHDILSTQYIIPGYSFAMIHVGTIIYITQLLAVLAGRYIFALKSEEKLAKYLREENLELEKKVALRTEDLRKQNELVEQKNRELEKAISEKDHLMDVVAHDLKAPLSSIINLSDLLSRELEGKSAEFNKLIKKVTLGGRKLIEDMAELKVYEEGAFSPVTNQLVISNFYEQKVLSFKGLAEKKNIKFSTRPTASNTTIETDETILNRIVDNLISNAIKFSPQGSEVTFEMNLSGKSLMIVIKDTGPGFNQRDKEKLFNKFQRLSARPTAGESSTGLGLSIVKTLIDALGGTISLESEEGNGAEFTVQIPVNLP